LFYGTFSKPESVVGVWDAFELEFEEALLSVSSELEVPCSALQEQNNQYKVNNYRFFNLQIKVRNNIHLLLVRVENQEDL
jgi:hypothetical protein